VAPTPEALAGLAELDEPLQDDPENPAAVLDMLDRIGSPATMEVAGKRFLWLRHRWIAARYVGG
jgi:hypothetical protein